MRRPAYLGSWAFGDVTGDQVRRDKRLAKSLKAVAKIDRKIADAEDKLAALQLRQTSVFKKLSGWLGSWF